MSSPLDSLYTTDQVAEYLGVSVRRVQQLILSGDLPASQRGGMYFLTYQDVVRFAAIPRPTGRSKGSGKSDNNV